MKELAKGDRLILELLSEGLADHEICRELVIGQGALARAVKRIEARAATESEDAGRFYERALKRRAERRIVSLDARFRALMEILPQAVIVADGRTGLIKEFNEPACELFGYSRGEMQGMKIETLVHPSKQVIHPAYRIGFLASMRKREMGYHPPILGVKRDGSKVEMAIALTATAADDDVMVICSEFATWEEEVERREAKSDRQ